MAAILSRSQRVMLLPCTILPCNRVPRVTLKVVFREVWFTILWTVRLFNLETVPDFVRRGSSHGVWLALQHILIVSWWRHKMETFSALLALCAGNSPATGEFPSQRPVTRSFDVFFDLCLNKRLSKQSWGWWFETPSHSLWRHCNVEFQCWPWTPNNSRWFRRCRWHIYETICEAHRRQRSIKAFKRFTHGGQVTHMRQRTNLHWFR